VVGRGAVPAWGVHDYGSLVRRLSIDFRSAFLGIIVSLISASRDEAREVCQPLRPAERLNVLLQNLIRGRRAGSLLGDLIWHFQNRDAVLFREIGSDAGSLAAAMAGVARQHAAPAEIAFVDGGHHQNHLARSLFIGVVFGIIGPVAAALLDVAKRAVLTEGGGEE